MNEQPTAREIRQGITEKLATMPAGTDHDGRSDLDRQADRHRFARFSEAETPPVPETPAQVGLKRNPAQGAQGAAVPGPDPVNVLDAIRAKASQHTL